MTESWKNVLARPLIRAGVLVALGLGMASTASANAAEYTAAAELRDGDGMLVGEVLLRDTPHGALLHARLLDLPPGGHGFHIHEVGKCEPPFTSAGGHYNPESTAHGVHEQKGMHAGDMPNIHVPSTGKLEIEVLNSRVTVDQLLSEESGVAIVVHKDVDDYSSDPAGAAGPRIACGVVRAR